MIGWSLAACGVLGLAAAAWHASPWEMVRVTHEVLGNPTAGESIYVAVSSALYATCGVGMLRGARWSRVAYLLGTPAGYLAFWVFVRIAWLDATVSVGLYLVPLWYLTRPGAGAYFTGPSQPRPKLTALTLPRPGAVAAVLVISAGAVLAVMVVAFGAAAAYAITAARGVGLHHVGLGMFAAIAMTGAIALVAWGGRLWDRERPRRAFGVGVAAAGVGGLAQALVFRSLVWAKIHETMGTMDRLPYGLDPVPSVANALSVFAGVCIPVGVYLYGRPGGPSRHARERSSDLPGESRR